MMSNRKTRKGRKWSLKYKRSVIASVLVDFLKNNTVNMDVDV